ncbi:hypothetical protein BTS2_1999 [Bacillus sp. TS-2]|nr:hypothetical protein BTS2_1999 [Bacillus sp. TS-2]
MALITVNFFSKAMNREVPFQAIIPLEPADGKTNTLPLKSLYLLHGYHGGYTDWLSNSRIRDLAYKYNIAVFMPAGENHFYLDDEEMEVMYAQYVGEELVNYTRQLFPLSSNREDTFIGGFSMGGYGAIRNGLKYHDTFGRIIALSSALITYKIHNIDKDFDNGIAKYGYYRRVFGDLTQLLGSDKDPEAIVEHLMNNECVIPQLFIACGTEDFLLDVNHMFYEYLKNKNIDVTYHETKGDHNWDFWNEYIEKGLRWAMTPVLKNS